MEQFCSSQYQYSTVWTMEEKSDVRVKSSHSERLDLKSTKGPIEKTGTYAV